MQTFLPFPDFRASAEALDYRRLGKQRVEAFQLLMAVDDSWALEGRVSKKGWRNHPAAIMWRPYPNALRLYMNTMIEEWIKRGYKNNMHFAPTQDVTMPIWFGDPTFHASHRSNLLRKDIVFYGKYGWQEDQSLPYVWPT